VQLAALPTPNLVNNFFESIKPEMQTLAIIVET
jgi:hypothetical protein